MISDLINLTSMLKLLLLPFLLFAEIEIDVPNEVLVEKGEKGAAVVILTANKETRIKKISVLGLGYPIQTDCVKRYYHDESCVFSIEAYLYEPKSFVIKINHGRGKITKKQVDFSFQRLN